MNAPRLRGICPGLSVPMPTGDGLLVRLRPTAPVPLDAMVGFCEAACQHGNGTIEVSARGSLQVRGWRCPQRSPSWWTAAVRCTSMHCPPTSDCAGRPRPKGLDFARLDFTRLDFTWGSAAIARRRLG